MYKPNTHLDRVPGADGAPCNTLIHDIVQTTVHVTHTPHAGLADVGVLGQPVVQVVDVVGAGTSSEALDEGWQVELLQTGAGRCEVLAATRSTR